ncbi:glycosyltransferase family 2 protein [Propionivibrio sp.]|uniref:glycosyltransferase family 2 protein n=1 Tax=Propionivibrio sp. TaxID=2212460 RepID=UPI002607740F|nr:glycosyltransferase family 2 protein [Propionivibrio sp.]
MLISHVIPAHNSSTTILRTLESVFRWPVPTDWQVEAIVVDDGSDDALELAYIVEQFTAAQLVVHKTNRGMCAGRNSGIAASRGDIVSILDSDDELVVKWPSVMEKILQEWPAKVNICYAACQNTKFQITSQEPDYKGLLSLNDLLNERHSGEYIPLFRGEYIRQKPYIDLNMRKSCGIVSYINFALDGPFWITPQVLRIYHDDRVASVSAAWTTPNKARETAECYKNLFDRFAFLYIREAPKIYRTKLLRYAVYLKFSGLKGAWRTWFRGASLSCVKESLGVAVILVLGQKFGGAIAKMAKQIGLIRRYG